MKERGRPETAPIPSARRRGERWWDNPGALPDDQLLRVVRATVAVDRAVDRYRGKRWPA